jgi:double-stranded uracil-DNA glycosylase
MDPAYAAGMQDTLSHRVIEDWMGTRVETLADLIPDRPKAICVGINPAPSSVEAGHYYQGRLGQQFFGRLRSAGVLPSETSGWEDDEAVADGVGFTDLVKRPTPSAAEVLAAELVHGRALLIDKLERAGSPLLIFTFKKSAEIVFGKFPGNGLLVGQRLGGSEVFVMPGPYASRAQVAAGLDQLAQHVNGSRA